MPPPYSLDIQKSRVRNENVEVKFMVSLYILYASQMPHHRLHILVDTCAVLIQKQFWFAKDFGILVR